MAEKRFVEQEHILDFSRNALESDGKVREFAVRFIAECVSCDIITANSEAIPEDIFDIERDCCLYFKDKVETLLEEHGEPFNAYTISKTETK